MQVEDIKYESSAARDGEMADEMERIPASSEQSWAEITDPGRADAAKSLQPSQTAAPPAPTPMETEPAPGPPTPEENARSDASGGGACRAGSPSAIAQEQKTAATATVDAGPGRVNINSADAQTLATGLKGVGESRAMEIVRYREAYGPFASIDELAEVKGIGKSTLDSNRDVITLE